MKKHYSTISQVAITLFSAATIFAAGYFYGTGHTPSESYESSCDPRITALKQRCNQYLDLCDEQLSDLSQRFENECNTVFTFEITSDLEEKVNKDSSSE
jgi:hypothetical protein